MLYDEATMYCRWCGSELPAGATTCPRCGKEDGSVGDVNARVDQAFRDAARAAHELGAASARLAEKVAAHAARAAEDPKGSSLRAARKVAKDLDAARTEIERALREL